MPSSQVQRLLVLGATGLSGREVVQYLIEHPDASSFTLQLGARSLAKLEDLALVLGIKDKVELLHVDVANEEQVNNAVKGADVVISTVGPFVRNGTPVVKACVKHGVHYVDITGETPWILDMIKTYDYAAFKKHTIIIPSSGFDSMPSDLVAYLSVRTLKANLGPDAQVGQSVSAQAFQGIVSGGTLASTLAIAEMPRKKLLDAAQNYSISPVKGNSNPHPKYLYSLPHLRPKIVGSIFAMGGVNTRLVQRSWGIFQSRTDSDQAYGPNFSYDEFGQTRGAFAAIAFSAVFIAFVTLVFSFRPVRWLVRKFGPVPGVGPTHAELESGRMRLTNVTSSDPDSEGRQTHVKTVFKGNGDPGYILTPIMVSESALALLPSNRSQLPALALEGGFLTPATALGDILIKKLRNSGRFEITSEIFVPGQEKESRKKR